MKSNLSHFAVIFPCQDPEAIATWYQDKLGFEISFRWENPASYIVTHKDEVVSIHFSKTDKKELQPCMISIFCHDVDAAYEELSQNDIKHISKPEDREYGMRDFDVVDPWGNRITYGKSISE
tara:strand:+ start:11363 stop:11728 length:366 start_codon:yes stop_codon:yes gene_type:complete